MGHTQVVLGESTERTVLPTAGLRVAVPPAIESSPHGTRHPRRTRRKRFPVLLDAVTGFVTLAPIVVALRLSGMPIATSAVVAGIGVLVLVLMLTWQGLYRGDIVRTLPTGLAAFTRAAKSVPMVALALAAALAFSETADPKRILGVAAVAAIPLMLTVPALRGIANVVRSRFASASNQRVLIVGCGDAAA